VREAARSNPALVDTVSRLGKIPVPRTQEAREMLGWAPRAPEITIIDTTESPIHLKLVAS